jgi:hypothetical protein
MEPTYFLYSGRLFRQAALATPTRSTSAMSGLPRRGEDTTTPTPRRGEDGTTSSQSEDEPQPRRGEDPSPEGPEGEPVGEADDEDDIERDDDDDEVDAGTPGPGEPIVLEHRAESTISSARAHRRPRALSRRVSAIDPGGFHGP